MAGAGHDERNEPNLELPSFFGRRKKRRGQDAPPSEDVTTEVMSQPSEPAPEGSTGPAPADPQPAAPAPGLRPAARAKRVPPGAPPRREAVPPAEPSQPEPEPEPVARAVEPAPAPVREDVPTETAEPRRRAPQPVARTVAPPPPRTRGPEMSFSQEPPTSVLTATRPGAGDDVDGSDGAGAADGVGDDQPRRRSRPSFRLPHLAPRLAAAVAGAVVGLAGVGLAWLALQGCGLVRGVSTCGGGPGTLALLLVLVAAVLLGTALLRALGADQPAGTSVVGVGLVVVVAMLTFPEVAMTTLLALVAMPVATAVTFVLAQVAATAVVDVGDQPR